MDPTPSPQPPSPPVNHTQNPAPTRAIPSQIPQSQRTGRRRAAPGHQQARDSSVPRHALAHTSALSIRPSRGPEGLRRPWGTGAAGSQAPGLIGDPGNNEGWEAEEASGLIGLRERDGLCLGQGPASDCAVPAAELRLTTGTQRSDARKGLWAARVGEKWGHLSKLRPGPGPLEAPEFYSISLGVPQH